MSNLISFDKIVSMTYITNLYIENNYATLKY